MLEGLLGLGRWASQAQVLWVCVGAGAEREGVGALTFGTTCSVGGFEPNCAADEVRWLPCRLAVCPAVAAVLLAWVVVGEVAVGAKPSNRHLLAIDGYDSRLPTFFERRLSSCRS